MVIWQTGIIKQWQCGSTIGGLIKAIKEAGITNEILVIVNVDYGGIKKKHGKTIEKIEISVILWDKGIKKEYTIQLPIYMHNYAAIVVLGAKQPYAWIRNPVKATYEGVEPENNYLLKTVKMYRASEGDINTSKARKDWQENINNPKTLDLLERDAKYFMHQGMSTPCLDVLNESKGVRFSNLDGKEFFDFHGNNVHQMGYGHPRIKKALQEQIESLPFSPRRYTNEPAVQFAEKIASLCPSDLNRILMTPNGSSAIGIALKIARGITGKFKVLSFWDSFHGASLDAVSLGGEAVFRDKMGPLLPGVERIPPPTTYRGLFADDYTKCLEYIEYVIEKEGDFGAFIGETIRNTDVQIPHEKFWKGVREICDKHNILLILDEVPIAFGRTGKMFAFENFDIEPDILCLGKGLGAGIFPQACVVTRDRFNVFQDISLGHYTHEKSPVGARVALEQIFIIEDDNLLDKVLQDQEYMKERLMKMKHKYTLIGDIRGLGLLWALEMVESQETKEEALEATELILYECLRNGLSFKISRGNVIQLSPPVTISRQDLKKAMDILEASIASLI